MGGVCKNPYDLTKSCGTSSTGSGASVASGMGIIGIGTDTTGSIVFPSTYNGLWGLRPLIDLASLDGVITRNNLYTTDVVGPMTKNLDDLILAYSIINGYQSGVSRNYQNRRVLKYKRNII